MTFFSNTLTDTLYAVGVNCRFASEYVSPLDSVVILDGAPVVGTDKAERLLKAIIKSANKEASLSINSSQIEMPTDESGNSKGFMFVSLENPMEATAFQRAMHGLAFDKRHTFSVVPFTEVEDYNNLGEEYQEPEEEEWAPRVS
jgi:translation initiation factor 3 subunit B